MPTSTPTRTPTNTPVPAFTIFGNVLLDGTAQGIPGSRVEFRAKVDGRWIPSGSMIVGTDGFFSFTYVGQVQAISLEEIDQPGYASTSARPIQGATAPDANHMVDENPRPGARGAYVFYDAPLGYNPGCGCTNDVVFHSNRDGNWELYKLTPGSSAQPTNLTHGSATDMPPAIGLNGQVAFQSNRDGNWEIYLADRDGRYQFRLTSHPADDTHAAWSPVCPGARLAFQSNRDGHWEIYLSGTMPNSEQRLTNGGGDSSNPMWSADGQWIAFQSNRDGYWEIYIINANTREERRLTNQAANDVMPAWSSDGKTLAFLSDRDGNWEVYSVNVHGGALARVTNTSGEERNVAWSPNGQWLAFQSRRNGTWEIVISRPNGAEQRVVAASPAADQAPTWNCDSNRLVFQSDRDGNPELHLIDPFADGAVPQRLTNNPAQDIFPAWQPTQEQGSRWGTDLADDFPLIATTR